MKILITGANGMLGSSLCRLFNEHHVVHAQHRDKKCFASCSSDYSLDLTYSRKVEESFVGIKPELVIHCAGLASIDKCEKDPNMARLANVNATENIARTFSNGTKLVYISTDQVYGDSIDHSENNERLCPVNQYGKSKLEGERKVWENCSNYMIIRTNIFGWNVKPGKISSGEWIYQSLKDGKKINLFTDYTFSPIYDELLGDIIMQLAEKDFSGVINVGSSDSCSKYEFGMAMAEEFGLDKCFIFKGSLEGSKFSAKRCKDLSLNVSKLFSLGFIPPDYLESLKQFKQQRKH